MAFIVPQFIKRDESGMIVSGSASIQRSEYIKDATHHSRRVLIEDLGKVLYLADDKKSGIFLSETRGLVEYNVRTDTFSEVTPSDERIKGQKILKQPSSHTVFGDTYLFLNFLKNTKFTGLLRNVFEKKEDYERTLIHILHGILRDGGRITCDDFFLGRFIAYVMPDIAEGTLKCDSRFFTMMGDDNVKVAYFKAYVEMMREENPEFGKACYVDSTPLPNDITDNPFNALCCHGVGSSKVMTRLALVLDEATGLPVWFDIIPGNLPDVNTLMSEINNVAETLGIEICSLVLDAGYTSKELIDTFHIGTDKTIISRMPARKGYPHKELYWELSSQINQGKYVFSFSRHAYFGKKRKIKLFDQEEYAYVYVDKNNALEKFNKFLIDNPEEYEALKLRDKNWYQSKFGYFVLISNIDTNPRDLLEQYFGRIEIESVIKTAKEYLQLLPLDKWTDKSVRGKILLDIIDTTLLTMFRKKLNGTGYSTTEVFGKCQSLICTRNGSRGTITVDSPSKQVKTYYEKIGVTVPNNISEKAFMKDVLQLKM